MKWNTSLKLVETYAAKNIKLIKTSPVFPGWGQFILGNGEVKVTVALTGIVAELYSFTITRVKDGARYVFFNESCAKKKIYDIICGLYNVVDTELKYKVHTDEQFVNFHRHLETYVNQGFRHVTEKGTELGACA